MGPGLPLPDCQQAGRAILAIIIITLGKPTKGVISLEPDDQCAAVGQSSQFTCETTVTTGQFLWQREQPSTPGKLVQIASNYIGAVAGYSVTYDETGSPVRSTLTVLDVNPTMNGDKYLCSREAESRRATLTVSECSWCVNVETAGLAQYVSVNSRPVPATCELKAGRFDFKLDLSSSPQEFGVTMTMTLDGGEVSGASKTMTYDCATAYSPLTISGITLNGGQLTVLVTINHPSLSSTEFHPIRDCTVTAPPTSTNISPANQYIVIQGEDADITCKASGGYPESYQYRYKSPTNQWSEWGPANKTTYSGRDRTMSGQYSCQSKTTGGDDGPTAALDMTIHYPPEDMHISASNNEAIVSYRINEGTKLTMKCEADSYPASKYRWTKEGQGFPPQNKAQLEIDPVEQTDTGKYTCTATNTMKPTGNPEKTETAEALVTVTVQYKPGPATAEKSVLKVTEKKDVTLRCSVSKTGEPQAKFNWTKSGEGSDRKTNDLNGEYTITSADFANDDGEFECVPWNIVGSGASATITVEVQTMPTVEAHPQDTTVVNTARNFEMKCRFQARPASNVTWKYSNDTDLPTGIFSWSESKTQSGHEQKLTTTESTLTWNAGSNPLVRRYSGGQIQCVANNGIEGPVESNQAKLVVEYIPDVYRTDPRDFKRGAAQGEEVRLLVEAIANPQPEELFQWQIERGASSFDIPADGYVVENTYLSSILIIQNITKEQFANYSVTATNTRGSDSVTFQVTAYDVPDEPTDLSLTATAVSLTAEWNRGWNGGLTQVFVLEYQEGAKQVKVKHVEDLVDERYHSVKLGKDDGIKESTEYMVTIHAKNSKGNSDEVSRTMITKAIPTVNTDATIIDHNKDANQAKITWSVSAKSFTRVVVKVCNVKEECLSRNITDITEPSTVTVPDGNDLSFSFTFFDGLEQVSEQRDAIEIEPATKTSDNHASVIGAVVGAVVVLALIIAILAFLIIRRKRRARGKNEEMPGEGGSKAWGNIIRGKFEIFRAARKQKTKTKAKVYDRTNPTYVNEHMAEPEYARLNPATNSSLQEGAYEEVDIRSRECTKDAVELGSLIHKGVFSEVFNGTIQDLPGFERGTRVIVKLAQENAPVFEQSMLLNATKALKDMGHHPSVVKLLAQSIRKDPVMAVLALEENGTLRSYLQGRRRELLVNEEKQQVLIGMFRGVLNGMAYLDSLRLRVLHHCVSADHVLVSKDGVCKVSGFGYATDILEIEEYERSQGMEETLRWMAPEQIRHYEHTQMSDMWSCGVLLWEMFNYGVEPYSDMTGKEVKQCILSGGMLGRPEDATNDMYDVMQKCWEMNPETRPKIGLLLNMVNMPNNYITIIGKFRCHTATVVVCNFLLCRRCV